MQQVQLMLVVLEQSLRLMGLYLVQLIPSVVVMVLYLHFPVQVELVVRRHLQSMMEQFLPQL